MDEVEVRSEVTEELFRAVGVELLSDEADRGRSHPA